MPHLAAHRCEPLNMTISHPRYVFTSLQDTLSFCCNRCTFEYIHEVSKIPPCYAN